MRSLFAMILAMMIAIPAVSTAQQEQTALRRVHVMTGAGTLPRNPANRLEFLRYATTGEPRLTVSNWSSGYPRCRSSPA